ncbi:MAG: alpha/beta hydrolase [Clostridia bacterium]|nr:alpha/beta hydrolase [Clostridia bacterium]
MKSIGEWFFTGPVKKGDAKRVASQPVPDFDEEYLNIPYMEDGHVLHQLNVYRPKDSGKAKLPVIFDIHGGGWYYGDKELNAYYCKYLTKNGFAVVDISYRVSPEVDFFGQIKDVVEALNFLPNIAEEYGLDLDNFFITGDSAGGHITSILVNMEKNEALQQRYGVHFTQAFKGACLTCPAVEPLKITPTKGLAKIYFNPVFGKGFLKTDIPEITSFSKTFTGETCPLFFITAYADFLKKVSLEGYEFARDHGVKCELFFADKKPEDGRKLEHVFNIIRWEWPESQAANDRMCDFFKTLLLSD